jgi:Cu-processing system permease protein
MRTLVILARKEIADGLRNRWVAAAILLLAGLALALSFLGAAPGGSVKASTLSLTVASLSSLTVYLLPLVALVLAYDALVGEFERGTMLLLLSYPVARWQVIFGKFLGHLGILVIAIVVGYGGAGLVIAALGGSDAAGWRAFSAMVASSVLLGAVFLGLGYLLSALVAERATAAGLAIALWLVFVVLYDLALLGLLLADSGQTIGQEVFAALMLINPTDAYRIFNLTGFAEVSQAAGIAGIGVSSGLGTGLPLVAMALWVALPLAATTVLFQRKEL